MSSKSSFKNAKKKVQLKDVQDLLQNLQMAIRMMQFTMGRLSDAVIKLDRDMGQAMGVLNDLQYRTLAMMELGQFDKERLEKTADDLKRKDFEQASAQEDQKKNYIPAESVANAECDVILTSFCQTDAAKSIFRSRISLGDITDPKLQEKFLGLKVGDVTTMTLLGVEHAVEILGVRVPAPKTETPAPQETVS
jgi:hypothetical protein